MTVGALPDMLPLGVKNHMIIGNELDPVAFPDAAELQADWALGRLTVTTFDGDLDDDGL